MRRTFVTLCALFAAIILVGAGCETETTGPDGGVYRTSDRGNTWESKSNVLTTQGAVASFANVDVNVLVADPNDPKALWAGTMANGILYTIDNGEGWLVARSYTPESLQLTQSRVNGIAVDPKNSCAIYAVIMTPTVKSHLVRSTNCGRDWGLVYTLEAKEEQLNTVAVSPRNGAEIYVGSSTGDIFRSENGGTSWVRVHRIEDAGIRTIVVHPKKDGVVYAGTRDAGLYKSTDRGLSWAKIDLRDYAGSAEVYVIAFDETKADTLLVGSKYGILRSDDGGATWHALQLLTAPGETQIISLGINKNEPKRIYYGTPTAFYRSEDGGATWTSKRVPTNRVIKSIVVNSVKSGAAELETVWVAAWSGKR